MHISIPDETKKLFLENTFNGLPLAIRQTMLGENPDQLKVSSVPRAKIYVW